MTVTIELNPQTEGKLSAQAQAIGVPLDRYLQSVLEQLASASAPLPAQEREKAFEEWANDFNVPVGVREGAFHRETWYR